MISFQEVFDLILMTLVIGFIFKDYFKKRIIENFDPIKHYNSFFSSFDFSNLWYAALVAAPGIVLHEMGHKFVALSFGFNAVFHAAYEWLFIGLVLRLMNFPFIFFVPGYVEYTAGPGSALASALISISGPLMNFMLFGISKLLLRYVKMKHKYKEALILTSKINLFLGIFNMLPFPPFDGYNFFANIIRVLF